MKVKTERVVRVTVTSKLPELKDKMVLGKLVDKGATWDAFLKNNWITLNHEEYCISALKGRVIVTIKDKVAKVVEEYRMTVPEYKVQIVRKIPEDLQDEGHPDTFIHLRPRASLSDNKLNGRFSSQEEEPLEQNDIIDVEADVVNNGDDFVFVVPQARPPRSHHGRNDRVNIVSSTSGDMFPAEMDKSIKEYAIEKLRACATNGYVNRVRQELLSLQANRKGLRVNRYLPYTLNVLGVIFDTNELPQLQNNFQS